MHVSDGADGESILNKIDRKWKNFKNYVGSINPKSGVTRKKRMSVYSAALSATGRSRSSGAETR